MGDSKKVALLSGVLCDLLNSSNLDFGVEARNCLEFFSNYNWLPAPRVEEDDILFATYNSLRIKGMAGEMSELELSKFVGLCSSAMSNKPLYFVLAEGRKLLGWDA